MKTQRSQRKRNTVGDADEVVKSMVSRAVLAGFESHLCCSPILGKWLTSLRLRVLVYKMGMIKNMCLKSYYKV